MNELRLDQIQAAIRDGSLDSADKATLDRYYRETLEFYKGELPTIRVRPHLYEEVDDAAQTLRTLISIQNERENQDQRFSKLQEQVRSLSKPNWVAWATLVATAIAAISGLILLFR